MTDMPRTDKRAMGEEKAWSERAPHVALTRWATSAMPPEAMVAKYAAANGVGGNLFGTGRSAANAMAPKLEQNASACTLKAAEPEWHNKALPREPFAIVSSDVGFVRCLRI